jgi:hypothetical protein
MYGIITETNQCVSDNVVDSSGEPRKGLLVFKKKSNAVTEAESLNEIRKRMKISHCYSVQKATPEDVPDCGIILDGVWKQKL